MPTATDEKKTSLFYFGCDFSGWYNCGKIIKIVATIGLCHILKLRCTKFDFGWSSASDPAGGAYSAPPGPLSLLKGPTFKGKEGEGKGEGKDLMEGEGKG